MTDVRFSDDHESTNPDETWDAEVEQRAVRNGDGSISVRRVRDNSEVALLPGVGAGIERMHTFSRGGRYLAVSYFGGRNVVWDIQKHQPVIDDNSGGVSADFDADGQTFAVICQNGQLRQFGLNPVRPLPSLALNRRYHALRLRPQGDWFAVYGWANADLEVRDLRDGSLLKMLSHPSHVSSFVWSSDGMHLAVGCENGRIFIWNALTGEKENELQRHEDSVVSVGFSHSGWLLGSSSWDGQFRLWDVATGHTVLTAAGWSFQVLFTEDDRRIGYVQRGRNTGSLTLTPSSIFHRLNCKASALPGSYSIDVSPDGRLVASVFAEGVHIWADQRTEEPFLLPASSCYSVIVAPDGTNLITCGRSGLARWPISRIAGTTTDELRIGPQETIRGLDFNFAALSLDGRWVAAANFGSEAVSIYEVRNPTNCFEFVSQPRVQFPEISPDGRWVAAGNWKGSGVKVWDFESKREVCTLPTPSSAWVGFSPDNRWVLTTGASYDLWETGSWKHKHKIINLPGSEVLPLPFAFSPDAITLAIMRERTVIQLIVAETGEVLANLEAPGAPNISYLRFSPDGSRLFALEYDQQVQVWDLRRIREELRKLNLDWNAPPIPAEAAGSKPVVKLRRISIAETVSPEP